MQTPDAHKQIGEPSFVPNERLVRDYVAKGILSKPERKGKEALFSFEHCPVFGMSSHD